MKRTKINNGWMGTLLLLLWGSLSAGMAQTTPNVLLRMSDRAACSQWVEQQLEGMTLKEKIGQLVIHTVAPLTTEKNRESLQSVIREYAIGGLLFSGGEVERQVQLTNLAQQWSKVPLLVTFDGEWGLSMRLKGTPGFPRNRILGCIANDTLLYRYGREVARQLREIGVQVNFAPVADVDNNPANPVINTRSFGASPQEVARKVVAYARGLEDGGILAVCKHFPGHGDTETDSHRALPHLPFDRARLDSVEWVPFRAAIRAGIGGMMVGHLHVPQLSKRPASVSGEMVRQTLQEELGFEGLTFTDALEMKGIAAEAEVSAQALMAGNDMVLARRNLKQELAGVMKAVKDGRLTEEQITAKCRKVLTYKYALGLAHRVPVAEGNWSQRLETAATRELAADLQRASVTVLKNADAVLPLDLSLSGTILLSLSSSLADDAPFYQALKESVDLTWVKGNAYSMAALREKLRPAQRVVVALHTAEWGSYAPLLKELAAAKPLIIVAFGTRKQLLPLREALPKAAAVVLAHTGDKEVQQYVADVLAGKAKAEGRLSVGFAGFPAGTGVVVDPERPVAYLPSEFGIDTTLLAEIDTIVVEGLRAHAYPGCHVLITKKGYPVYNKCFGSYTYEGKEPVRENSLYDLASLSKVTGTLLAVMKLYDEGRFGLTDRVSRYLPWLKGTDKERLTVQDLLFHQSGLPAYLPFYRAAVNDSTCKGGWSRKKPDRYHRLRMDTHLYVSTEFSYLDEWVRPLGENAYALRLSDSLSLNPAFREELLQQIVKTPLRSRTYRYSCLNFILLKEMVEVLAEEPMDEYLDRVFYRPMGLQHTAYRPLRRFSREQIVPTVQKDLLRRGEVRGYVQDEAAAFLGGVSGNAGLFSTARDVAVIFQLLLDKGVCGDRRYLTRSTCELFTTMKARNSRRGLGFDKPQPGTASAGPCAPNTPACVFGHTGYTGTCAWADPENDLVYVFLSNRVYPQVYGSSALSRLDIRSRIQEVMYRSLKK